MEETIQLKIPRRIFEDPRFLTEFIHLYAEIDNIQEDEMELSDEVKKKILEAIRSVQRNDILTTEEILKRFREKNG